jgi:hypothetical protein
MITKEIALSLKIGAELQHANLKNSRGTPLKARVNGICKTWKSEKRQHEFKLPIKHGLYWYGHVEPHNAADWKVPEVTQESQDEAGLNHNK